MEKKDRNRFKLAIDKTALILPSQNLDPKEKTLRIEVFWETFEYYKIDNVEEAFKWAREELKFFPTPKDLIDHLILKANTDYLENKKHDQLPWIEPTEAGKIKAKEIVKTLFDKWDEEDIENQKKKAVEFEKRRAELKEQARKMW